MLSEQSKAAIAADIFWLPVWGIRELLVTSIGLKDVYFSLSHSQEISEVCFSVHLCRVLPSLLSEARSVCRLY